MLKRFITIAAVVVSSIAMTGCFTPPPPEPSRLDTADAVKLINNSSYVMDIRNGLCYNIMGYSRVSSGGTRAEGVSHTIVPCENVNRQLINAPKE